MKLLFWISLLWLSYAYVGYLCLLTVITRFRRRTVRQTDATPPVTMLIAAYNEEGAIEEKIHNCLGQDYPPDKLEIIIVSDSSTDRTDEIVARYAKDGVRLIRQPVRRGKTSALNLAIEEATGEILVFSDATTYFPQDTVEKLVRNFGDPLVGCVGGEPRFRLPDQKTMGEEVSQYWRYERLLRIKESEFNTLIGVSGCVFAIRRELAEPLREDLIEDLVLPLKVAGRGYRVVYEQEAVAYEEMSHTGEQELNRMVRVVVGGVNALWHMKSLLNPIRHPRLAFQLFSHKICRWLAPFFHATFFLSTLVLMLSEAAFLPLGTAMITFVTLSVLGGLLHNRGPLPRLLKIPYYFMLINLAFLAGLYQFLAGERHVTWDPIRS